MSDVDLGYKNKIIVGLAASPIKINSDKHYCDEHIRLVYYRLVYYSTHDDSITRLLITIRIEHS